jgi:hypothetical protein
MRRIAALLISSLVLFSNAFADSSGVLIENVPTHKAAVMAAVKQAFLGRRWTIESADDSSVTAVIDHNRVKARMRVALSGDDLIYEEHATQRQPASRAPSASFGDTDRTRNATLWRENVRFDLSALLAGIPKEEPSREAEKIDTRLRTLDGLRASGSITEDEYKVKRAEILAGL